MHMGAMGVIGAKAPKNLVHAVINNGASDGAAGRRQRIFYGIFKIRKADHVKAGAGWD